MILLSTSEYEILTLMWTEKRGLTAVEINELSENKTWKPSSIHLIINSMLEKGAIKADGMIRSGKVYSRLFVPTITPEEYTLAQVTTSASFSHNKSAIYTSLFSALIDSGDINSEDIAKLEAILKNKKGNN